jgi:uncharacterized protein YjdB
MLFMKKYIFLILALILFSATSFAIVGPITGTPGACVGDTAMLADTTSGGIWSSSNTSVATISFGIVTGVSPGTSTISYTKGLSSATYTVTISMAPGPITGILSECVGGMRTLSDSLTGGQWSTPDVFILAIGSATGKDTGISAGIATVYYTMGPGCSVTALDTVKTTPTPDSVHGPSSVCRGSTITMTDATPGGAWSSSNPAVATIVSSGVVTGVAYGFVTISYAVTGICGIAYAPVAFVKVDTATVVPAMSGPSTVCLLGSMTLSDATLGGTWTSSSTLIATVGLYTGVVSGVNFGSATITYTVSGVCGSGSATKTVTVVPAPSAGVISGPSSVCVGAAITLTDAVSGGVWSSSSTMIATVGSGSVTGVSTGLATISYAVTGSCTAYATKTVSVITIVLPAPITGPASVCIGSTITLSDATPGGVWSSLLPTLTVGSGSGVVTGISGSYGVIRYTVIGTCGSAWVLDTIGVISAPNPGVISGSSTVMATLTTTLSETVGGSVWTSGNTAVATIDLSTGIVTGVSPGTATITYTVTGCGGSADTTFVITVTTANIIEGIVNFTGVPYVGNVKVWLIKFDPGTLILEAIDSQVVFSGGTKAFYQFLGEPGDSFRIKAAINDSSAYGYLPTYHTSDFYWYNAAVLWHTATIDAGQDINMLYGARIPGPGFIAGNVMSGANKGTLVTVPSVGLQLYCINAVTGKVVQQTTTDNLGHYQFDSLLVSGSYYVHPELLNYLSTDYPTITLTSSAPSVSTASFIQHTVSHTITPIGASGVNNINEASASVNIYPNPANGKLNIKWQDQVEGKADVIVNDITCREIFRYSVDMAQGRGNTQIDLSGVANGLYMISVRSATINYNNKIQVQH